MKAFYLAFCLTALVLNAHAQEKYISTTDGVKLYVKIKGSGTPCLYIHGGPGSGSYWLEKFFGDFLEQHFQMIYLDQRGVGRSSSPDDHNYSLDRLIADCEEVREALGIKQWLTLGHSFGGIIQVAYAEKHFEANMGMMMINCTLSMRESFCSSWIPKASSFLGVDDAANYQDDPTEILNKMMSIIGKLNEKELMWKMAFASQENDKLMNESYGEFPTWNNDFGAVALTINDYWKDYRGITSKIKIPVLFFYGRADWAIGPEHFKGIEFPDMMLWGSDVGHMPFLENKPDLEKALQSFIDKYEF